MKSFRFNSPAIISAILLGLAQQPIGCGFLAWFAFIPWLVQLEKLTDLKQIIISFSFFGFFYHLITIFWLAMNIGTGPVTAVISMFSTVIFLTLMIFPGALIWYVLQNLKSNRVVIFSILWTVIEYSRSLGPLAFPWTSIANSQISYNYPIQIAEITGIYGVAFWIVLLNGYILKFIRNRNVLQGIRLAAVFSLPWIIGIFLVHTRELQRSSSVSVAVVQPNIHLAEKWDESLKTKHVNTLLDLSRPSFEKNDDLIIWPETALPVYLLKTGRKYLRHIRDELKYSTSTILTGIPHYTRAETNYRSYNSAVVFNHSEVQETYNKIQLVPMAEYVPLSGLFPSLSDLNFGQANFTRGTQHTVYSLGEWKFSTVICFESTLSALMRKFVLNGAEFLTIIVNDGWYETAPEPQQHARQAVYRAIENRRPVIRCANTGISMVIDPLGNILNESELNEKFVLNSTIYPQSINTFYTRFGDVFSWIMSTILLIIVIISIKKSK